MQRRSAGIVVLAVVALAMALLPAIGGQQVAGRAVSAAVPMVDDCLVGVSRTGKDGDLTGGNRTLVRVLEGTPGDCSTAGAVRVTAVRFGVDLASAMPIQDVIEATQTACGPALSVLKEQWSTISRLWQHDGRQIGIRTDLTPSAQLIGPTGDARSGHWAACTMIDSQGNSIPATLNTRRLPSAFGRCFLRAADGQYGTWEHSSQLPCSQQHNAEELGSVYVIGDRVKAQDYQAACQEFAVTATGRADPTADGRLQVEAVETAWWTGGAGSCRIFVVDQGRSLTGSLLGIGSGPLPWAK